MKVLTKLGETLLCIALAPAIAIASVAVIIVGLWDDEDII